MKALLVCSVHALFDIATLERRAFNAALGEHGMPSLLGEGDHARISETTTMLEMISRAPCDIERRAGLVTRYLELLNDLFLNARCDAYKSVCDALLEPGDYARPKGFVSEYPLLTTNLARAAALLSNATKLGCIVAPLDPLAVQPMADGLAACAQSLDVSHDEVEVLVARRVDFDTVRSIGMQPTFIKEVRELGAAPCFAPDPERWSDSGFSSHEPVWGRSEDQLDPCAHAFPSSSNGDGVWERNR